MEALTNRRQSRHSLSNVYRSHRPVGTSFAGIREVSYYQTEEEILFSMHTVFRIGEIKQN